MPTPRAVQIPLKKCHCCGGRLVKKNCFKNATVYGFHHPEKVKVWSTRCTTKTCQVVYGPNWLWSKGKGNWKANCQRNMLRYSDFKTCDTRRRRPLFISKGTGLEVDFLDYHLQLMFRCGAGWKGAAFASAMVYPFPEGPEIEKNQSGLIFWKNQYFNNIIDFFNNGALPVCEINRIRDFQYWRNLGLQAQNQTFS